MKIDGGASYLFASQHTQANTAARAEAKGAFDALLTKETERSGETAATVEIEQADFTNMTRQELRDWMSEQLRSGAMSVDDSKALLGWVVDIRIDGNGRVVGSTGDDGARFNFLELVSGNRDFYLQRGDMAAATRIQGTLDLMTQAQGQITRFDARI